MHRVGFHYADREGDFANEQNDLSRSSRAMDVVTQCQFHKLDTAERNVHVLPYFKAIFLFKGAT